MLEASKKSKIPNRELDWVRVNILLPAKPETVDKLLDLREIPESQHLPVIVEGRRS